MVHGYEIYVRKMNLVGITIITRICQYSFNVLGPQNIIILGPQGALCFYDFGPWGPRMKKIGDPKIVCVCVGGCVCVCVCMEREFECKDCGLHYCCL